MKPEGDWQDRDARLELLAEVARDADRAVRAVEADQELIAAEEIAEAARLVREIIGQEFEGQTTMSRACAAPGEYARSSPPTTPRCATGARRRRGASPATSSTPQPRPKRRS